MDIPFELETGQAVGVTRHELNRILALQDGTAALLYCYLLSTAPQPFDIQQAALVMGVSGQEATRTFALLKEKGLISTVTPPLEFKPTAPVFKAAAANEPPPRTRGLVNDERPTYTTAQIVGAMEHRGDFSAVVREAESRMGKMLSPSDLQTLYGIYDWRGLPAGVIYLLITHCVEEARERYGPGRPPTMKAIDKEAALWEREGVDTESRAEEYLSEIADRRTRRNEIMSLLQIRGRAPSPTEDRYLKEWTCHSIDLIALAYDKTVIRTGNLSWKYMDTILKNWKAKNLTTPEDVESGDVIAAPKKTAPSAQPAKARGAAVDTGAGAREHAAVEEMKDFLKRLRVEEDF
jgi:DnaD/phage-associated family protein